MSTPAARIASQIVNDDDDNDFNPAIYHIFAQQSFINRNLALKKNLNDCLKKVINLLKNDQSKQVCQICYPWPAVDAKEYEKLLQPFLYYLYDNLKEAGIDIRMDIRDAVAGTFANDFSQQLNDVNKIVLVLTASLLKKYNSTTSNITKSELDIINKRLNENVITINLYQLLFEKSEDSACPDFLEKYKSEMKKVASFSYLSLLQFLIFELYKGNITSNFAAIESEYTTLWVELKVIIRLENYLNTYDTVLSEMSLKYHLEFLEHLQEDLGYMSLQIQHSLPNNEAADKIFEILIEKIPRWRFIFTEYGTQFQRANFNTPHYVKRKEIYAFITGAFLKNTSDKVELLLHGLGGTGKSTLANEYYRNPPMRYELRAWFDAGTREELLKQYIQLGKKQKIDLPIDASIEIQAMKVIEWLEKQKACLLVYDNISDPQIIENFLPKNGPVHILITSRNSNITCQRKLNIGMMSDEEATNLLMKINPIDKDKYNYEIKQLLNSLGNLPHAVVQAASYMIQRKNTIKEYLQRYYSFQSNLLSHKLDNNKCVWLTFNENFDEIMQYNPNAMKALYYASWLNCNSIPEELFLKIFNEKEWNDIKICLKNYSFIDEDLANNQFNMPILLQDILRARQTDIEKIQYYKEIYAVLHSILQSTRYNDHLYTSLILHVKRFQEHSYIKEFNIMPANTMLFSSSSSTRNKNNEQENSSAENVSDTHQKSKELSDKAVAMYKSHNYADALQVFFQLLSYYNGTPEEIATINYNIGSCYMKLDKYADAKIYLEFAYTARVKLLGEMDQTTKKTKERLEECNDFILQSKQRVFI